MVMLLTNMQMGSTIKTYDLYMSIKKYLFIQNINMMCFKIDLNTALEWNQELELFTNKRYRINKLNHDIAFHNKLYKIFLI